jgi:hypothetical protein
MNNKKKIYSIILLLSMIGSCFGGDPARLSELLLFSNRILEMKDISPLARSYVRPDPYYEKIKVFFADEYSRDLYVTFLNFPLTIARGENEVAPFSTTESLDVFTVASGLEGDIIFSIVRKAKGGGQALTASVQLEQVGSCFRVRQNTPMELSSK